MIFWNTAGTRAALYRALQNLAEHNEGAVMHLDLADGDVQLVLLRDEPMREEEVYAIRYPV